VSDESQLQVTRKDTDLSLVFSKTGSALVARGRRDAALLAGSRPARATPFSEVRQSAEEAAESSEARTQYQLGLRYEFGHGLIQDDAEAARWYRKAAEGGYARAQCRLGFMYTKGLGVPQDYKEAVKWYSLAADQGHAFAQFSLGVMYDTGQGLPQNYVRAHMWINLALAHANNIYDPEIYAPMLDRVAAKMNPAQIAEAQRLADAWKRICATEGNTPGTSR
jgi:TPR repeat protein